MLQRWFVADLTVLSVMAVGCATEEADEDTVVNSGTSVSETSVSEIAKALTHPSA